MSKNNNKDLFDTIDDYFSQINGEEIAQKVSSSVNNISKNISETIEDSLKNNGYNNFSEFVDGEFRYKKGSKPHFSKFLKEYSSRLEYVREAISSVEYEIKYRGYFKEGHQEALHDIQLLLDSYTNNLDDLEKRIKAQIKEIKLRSSHYKKAYVNGYINGCEYVQKAIHRSKRFMMDKILNEVL